jgi:hypothetical protein
MPYIIIIDKSGNVKEMNIKEYRESDLFKKANFKSPDGFLCQTKWEVNLEKNKYQVSVYGKTNGKAGQENKYEFPPPIDSVLFFGGCVLTNGLESISDLRLSDWNAIYENLMGGFEDLDADETEGEEEEEDETEEGNMLKISKDGYVCDDFVVEDEEVDYDNLSAEEESEEEESEEEEQKPVPKKKIQLVKTSKPKTVEPKYNAIVNNNYLDYQPELCEEEYL